MTNPFPPTNPFFAIAIAASLLGPQSPLGDALQSSRINLEEQRRELLADVQNPRLMGDQSRATLARLSIESGWKRCAENEAADLARSSEKPARLLAETALAKCGEWERILHVALDKGAYPYLDGHLSREDMVTMAELESRQAAIDRILLWRGVSVGRSSGDRKDAQRDGLDRPAGAPLPSKVAPPQRQVRPAEPPSTAPVPPPPTEISPSGEEEQVITVTAQRGGACRVRLADRTLTDRELAANAKQWAASNTPLRVIRPRGADYHCMAKIAWRLGDYGVRFFHFVDAPMAK